MAYSTVSQVALGVAISTDPKSNFYLQDISFIMSQPGAIGVHLMTVKSKATAKEGHVLVAVEEFDPLTGEAAKLLDKAEDLIALGCPPFLNTAGEFIANP